MPRNLFVDVSAGPIFVKVLELGGDGLSVGVKDCIDVAGFPTCAGSATLASAAPAARHARVVAALLEHGCRIVGKTNMHELAYGVTGVNAWTGTPTNPRYPDLVPGGSSSGSAVSVAAGLVDFAIGTDTGGSIRVPAACCGIYGLKPSFGRISRVGVHPAHSSLDCVGPLALNVAMLERAMTIMDPDFAPARPPRSIAIGVADVKATARTIEAVSAALSGKGAELSPISLPTFAAAFDAGLTLIAAENWAAFGHLVESADMGHDVRARLLAARNVSGEALKSAELIRVRFSAEVDEALRRVDALALPTLPDCPMKLVDAANVSMALQMTSLVRPFNLSGHPALSVPLPTGRAPPIGLQLIGKKGMDAELCAIAHRLVENLPHCASDI